MRARLRLKRGSSLPDELAHVAEEASRLLVAVAAGDEEAAQRYDTLLYPVLLKVVKLRGQSLQQQARGLVGRSVSVPVVPAGDINMIANDVTVEALSRARRNASKFDPARGDGATWAINAAALAYVDVVRTTYGTRRVASAVPVDPDELDAPASLSGFDPAAITETRAALDAALQGLTREERFVVLARYQAGMPYAEIALYLFDDAQKSKAVDNLLQSARRKLAAAERDWNAQ